MIFSMTQVDLMLLLMKTGKCYLKNNKEASNFAFSFYKSRVLSLFYNVLISRRTVQNFQMAYPKLDLLSIYVPPVMR